MEKRGFNSKFGGASEAPNKFHQPAHPDGIQKRVEISKYGDCGWTLLKLQHDPFRKREIKNRDLAKVLISVGIFAGGVLAYLIPGVGWVIGASLTSAGINGILSSTESWDRFALEVGIGAIIGAATSVIGAATSVAVLFENAIVQQAFKGAVIGALVSSSSELIRLGLDPKKDSINVLAIISGAIIGGLSAAAKFYFEQRSVVDDPMNKLNKLNNQSMQEIFQQGAPQVRSMLQQQGVPSDIIEEVIQDLANKINTSSCSITKDIVSNALLKSNVKTIAGSVESILEHLSTKNALTTISFGFPGAGAGLIDHHLVAFRMGDGVVVAQSWEGVFTFDQWRQASGLSQLSLSQFREALQRALAGDPYLFTRREFQIGNFSQAVIKHVGGGYT